MAVLNNTGILAGSSAVTEPVEPAYEIERSLRWNARDEPVLTRTLDGGNRRTGTVSFWMKTSRMDDHARIITMMTTESSSYFDIQWIPGGGIGITDYGTGNSTFYFEANANKGRRTREQLSLIHI